jgi:hypothetical protein
MNARRSDFDFRAAPPTGVTRQTQDAAQAPGRAPADVKREDETAQPGRQRRPTAEGSPVGGGA